MRASTSASQAWGSTSLSLAVYACSVKKLERAEAQRPSGVSIAVPEMVRYDFADGL